MKRIFFSGIAVFLLALLFIHGVSAAVGVKPAIYRINFEPGLEGEFPFEFYSDDGSSFDVEIGGDLAEYFTLDKTSLDKDGKVIVTMKLPQEIEVPGNHRVLIGGIQGLKPNDGGFGIRTNVQGVISIEVPYPGQYADVEFHATDANAGEDVVFDLKITSKGQESIDVNSYIEIYDGTGKFVDKLEFDDQTLQPTESVTLEKRISTENYQAGDYNATAVVNYGGATVRKDVSFRLGKLYIDIINITKTFSRGQINPVEITIRSYWNNDLKDVFGEIYLPDYDVRVKTPTVDLEKWQTTKLQGYMDTTPISNDSFLAYVTLYYGGTTTKEKANFVFAREENYSKYYIIGGVVVFLVLILVGLYLFVWRKRQPKMEVSRNDERKDSKKI